MAPFELLLLGSLMVLAYIYAGYPLLAIVLARLAPKPVVRSETFPSVTVIISAYNEERDIGRKIANVLAMTYPAGLVDVIVVSDASSDGTDRIVRDSGNTNVRLLRIEGRLGKTACQNAAAAVASGEILLFTDATTIVDSSAMRALTRNFHDPAVGCVAGRLVYQGQGDNPTGNGGTAYWNYETRLRLAESAIGSLIGVSGVLYAVRRSAYRPIRPDLISDFVIAMNMREQGLRTVLEPQAVCYEETLDQSDDELSMRVRVIVRSLFAMATKRNLLNPFHHGFFAWELWSHKVLRYLSPVFWAIALIANAALAFQGRYLVLMGAQLLLLSMGTLGFMRPRDRAPGWSRIPSQPYYFLLTNLASAISLIRFVRGDRIVTWTPLRRDADVLHARSRGLFRNQ